MRIGSSALQISRSRSTRPANYQKARRYSAKTAGARLLKKFDLSIGAGSSRIAPASELLYRMVCHSAGSWRTSREGANDSYCPWCTPYRRKALNDIDTVCGDMNLIDGVELSLETIDGHGAHLKMSHDNDIDRAWIPINYCPICGRNLRKDV